MRHIHKRLAIASLFFACAATTWAAGEPERFEIKDAQAPTGSMLKRGVVTGDLPYDKRYDQLTEAQRDLVKANYEPMAADDEPPFPADGLGAVMKALRKAASATYPRGVLDIAVEVGPDGVARSARIYHAPDDARFTQYAAQVLMLTKYKPAVCGGKACAMWFPLNATFTVSNGP